MPRHSHLNQIGKRTLNAAGIHSYLEPTGLDRTDGRRPDGVTVVPFSMGRSLSWDATCSDTFAQTSINHSAISAGYAANRAEERKKHHYSTLGTHYRFEPISVETSGVLGSSTSKFLTELGKRVTACTGDKREATWLRQRISLAIMRGNSASILATSRSAFPE